VLRRKEPCQLATDFRSSLGGVGDDAKLLHEDIELGVRFAQPADRDVAGTGPALGSALAARRTFMKRTSRCAVAVSMASYSLLSMDPHSARHRFVGPEQTPPGFIQNPHSALCSALTGMIR